MDTVIDQVLDKLLSERDKVGRLERALTDQRYITHRISELVDGPQDEGLIAVVATMQKQAARDRLTVEQYDKVEVGEVREAVEHALLAVGLTPSNNLRTDAENLCRFVVATRPPFGGIL
jgi:hypothetical protein